MRFDALAVVPASGPATRHPLRSAGSGRARSPASAVSGRRRRTEALASVRRSNWTCGFPASSFHRGASATQVQRRNQVDQPHESQLAVQVSLREPFPAPAAPTLESLRPDAPQDPTVETGEELADVGLAEILAPPADDRVEFGDQFPGADRGLPPGPLTDLVLEVLDRLLPRVRVEVPMTEAGTDLARGQPQGPAPALDLVPQELEAGRDVDDPRLLDVERHAQRLQDPGGLGQHPARFRPSVTRDHPIVSVPRQPKTSAAHLAVKRSQEDVTQQGGNDPALRGTRLGREALALGLDAGLEHALDQPEHPPVRDSLSHEPQQLLMCNRPEEIFEVGIDDPLRART